MTNKLSVPHTSRDHDARFHHVLSEADHMATSARTALVQQMGEMIECLSYSKGTQLSLGSLASADLYRARLEPVAHGVSVLEHLAVVLAFPPKTGTLRRQAPVHAAWEVQGRGIVLATDCSCLDILPALAFSRFESDLPGMQPGRPHMMESTQRVVPVAVENDVAYRA